jgi:hypothetical protein
MLHARLVPALECPEQLSHVWHVPFLPHFCLLQAVMADGSVADGTLAESQAQAAAIWRVREGITESLVRRGAHCMAVNIP